MQTYPVLGMTFFSTFSPSLSPAHSATLHHLSTLLLPIHVQSDEIAQRFRNEKYTVRMSRSGFGLLVGWLTEGFGGEAPGSSEGFSGEKGKRGRAAVMRVVNNHLRFDGECTTFIFFTSVCVYSLLLRSYIILNNVRIFTCMGRVNWLSCLCNPTDKRRFAIKRSFIFQCFKGRS